MFPNSTIGEALEGIIRRRPTLSGTVRTLRIVHVRIRTMVRSVGVRQYILPIAMEEPCCSSPRAYEDYTDEMLRSEMHQFGELDSEPLLKNILTLPCTA